MARCSSSPVSVLSRLVASRRPDFAWLLVLLVLPVALAGCENTDARATPAFAAEGETADTLELARLAEEKARADSIAEWEARFGDRVERPESLRALYVNAWAAGSRSRMGKLIEMADETEINGFVIDIKESDTYLTHDSTGIELAKEIGADGRPASTWLPALIDTLQARGIYSVARIVVFKDRMLAEERPDLAIRHVNGGVWTDQNGKPWVSPYNRTVWDYNIDIAREALDMGFSAIQWDYVRFPDVGASLRSSMAFPGADGVSREDNIASFIEYSKEQLAEYQVPITADVFGLATHMETDLGIGQQWEKVIRAADVVLPMVYPSHYYTGHYGFKHPVANPYEIIRISLQEAVERTEYLREQGEDVGTIMPWLEAQTATWVKPTVPYGPAQLREQIQATYDAGLTDWVLWHPGSKYESFRSAFRPADGSPSPLERNGWESPDWEVPRAHLSRVILDREKAERVAEAAADSALNVNAAPEPAVTTGAAAGSERDGMKTTGN